MSLEDLQRMVEAEAEALAEAEFNGREEGYRVAREFGGTAGMLDVFDAAVIRTIIKWLAPGSNGRRRFWADVKAEIER